MDVGARDRMGFAAFLLLDGTETSQPRSMKYGWHLMALVICTLYIEKVNKKIYKKMFFSLKKTIYFLIVLYTLSLNLTGHDGEFMLH